MNKQEKRSTTNDALQAYRDYLWAHTQVSRAILLAFEEKINEIPLEGEAKRLIDITMRAYTVHLVERIVQLMEKQRQNDSKSNNVN